MKTIVKLILVLLVLVSISSCTDKIEETYTVNEPIYMSYDELRSATDIVPPVPIVQPGKIYFKDDVIFVNEYQKGIHVVNNADPSKPEVIKFIEIPGNVDLAIKGNMLYVDSYVDLVTFDISDIENIKEVDRDTSVFPYIVPIVLDGYLGQVNRNEGVIVGYNQVKKTDEVDIENNYFPQFRGWGMADAMMINTAAPTGNTGGKSNTGTGGSMARFTLYDDYLYVVNEYDLKLFNISSTTNPQFENSVSIGWGIETIFPYEDKLFIGSRTGMFIYSITNPKSPQRISQFRHVTACDPVVVEGDYAYVTLRAGNLCGAGESQLDVIDISDIYEPKLLKQYLMEEPYGLGIDNDVLFVCDGDAGLKIYDATDKTKIDSNMIIKYPEVNAFDVIPLGEVLVMIGVDGLYQYDYKNIKDIYQLSHIPIYDK
ncbi:MAG: hypothetical protein MI922_02335 [Bacteroidales bacterium]|nr:hypothetical protein [Bacteroidales bacterium]